MTEAGAPLGRVLGPQVPLWPTLEGLRRKPRTLRRSTAFDIVGKEVLHTREKAGLIDISGYSRYEVSGPNAEKWLDRVFACKLPAGRSVLAPMLAPNGKLKGDLTIFNWGDGTFWIMGSYYPARMAHALVRSIRRGRFPSATSRTTGSASRSTRCRAKCCSARPRTTSPTPA